MNLLIRIYRFMPALLLFRMLTTDFAYAGNMPSPLWYNYILAGKQACQAKDYSNSERYYLGSLAELEKLAVKKKQLDFPRQQKAELSAFYINIEEPFHRSNEVQSKQRREKRQASINSSRTAVAPQNMQAAFQETTNYLKNDIVKMKQEQTASYNDEFNRQRRILTVYEVLLGPNSEPAQSCKKSIAESKRLYAQLNSLYDATK